MPPIDPGAFKGPGQLLLWMLATLFTFLLGTVAKKLIDGRPTLPPAPTPQREQVEQASGLSTAGVPDETVAFFAQLYAEIRDLRRREDQLEDYIVDLKHGVEAGKYPPWPDEPQRIPSPFPTHTS